MKRKKEPVRMLGVRLTNAEMITLHQLTGRLMLERGLSRLSVNEAIRILLKQELEQRHAEKSGGNNATGAKHRERTRVDNSNTSQPA